MAAGSGDVDISSLALKFASKTEFDKLSNRLIALEKNDSNQNDDISELKGQGKNLSDKLTQL